MTDKAHVESALHTAAKQALEALQKIYIAPEHDEYIRVWWPACEQAITTLRQALANEALDKKADNAREVGLDYEPAQQEPVATLFGSLPVYDRPQAREPLPFNKADMEGLDINQRLGFKLGWRSAEEAYGIKENT